MNEQEQRMTMEKSEKNTVSPRLKFWTGLAKWFIVSVSLVVMTRIIDAGFRERQADLAELKFYHEYATPAIVLNSSPVQKRMLAQYFACVSPSADLRERWKVYYDSVYPEYLRFVIPLLEEEKTLLRREEELKQMPQTADGRNEELMQVGIRLEKIRCILNPQLDSPGQSEQE